MPEPAFSHMSTSRFLTSALLIASVALLGGCDKLKLGAAAGPGAGGAPGAGQQGPPPEVGVVTIQPQRVELTTELSGRVAASFTAEVRPQVTGIIQNRLFTEGADVKAGEVLYQIDPATYQAAFQGAQASLSRAEANLAAAKQKAARYEELRRSEAISAQDSEDASAALKLTEAEIEVARAALDTARINLEYTKVRAPISGRIGRSTVTNGALVTANQATALATIVRLDPVYVDVTQSSTEMLRLRKALESGQIQGGATEAGVKLMLDDGSPYSEPGTLKFSEAFVDPSTGSVTLRTQFPNPKLILLPGMFVRARLQEGVRENGILVAQRGVSRNPAGLATVLVVNAQETVEPRVIKTDRTVGTDWLVTEGLAPGDRVILEGLQKARPGTPVKAVPFGQAPAAAPTAPAAPAAPAKH